MVKERKRASGHGGGGGVPTRELPHDLVAGEVLTRLPAKSLMRFKCVSKLWRSTISDPCFCKAHRARAAGGLIMVCPETSSSTSSIDEEEDNHNKKIVGLAFFNATHPGRGGPVIDVLHQFSLVSTLHKDEDTGLGYGFKTTNVIYGPFWISNVINGLFCLYNSNSVSICNFSTREIMDLPPPPTHPFLKIDYYFVFASTTKEYKLLKVCSVRCREDCSTNEEGQGQGHGEFVCFDSKFDILTLGKDKSWRSLHEEAPAIDAWTPSACIHGRIYWWDPYSYGRRLIYFCFDKEFFGFTDWQPSIPRHGAICQFRGDLAVLVRFVGQTLKFWVLKSGLWFLDRIQVPYAIVADKFRFLADLPAGEVLMIGVEKEEDGNSYSNSPIPLAIYSYDHTSGKSEKITTSKNSPSSSQKLAHNFEVEVYYYEEDITPLHHLITNK